MNTSGRGNATHQPLGLSARAPRLALLGLIALSLCLGGPRSTIARVQAASWHATPPHIAPGSVLLVDDFSSQFRGRGGAPFIFNVNLPNYASYYTQTLTALGVPSTLWDERVLGSPSLATLQAAAAVIYYTGDNQGQYNLQGVPPPVSFADQTTLGQYVAAGGRLFISGSGVGSAPGASNSFLQSVLHTTILQNSIYDGLQAPSFTQYQFGAVPPSPSLNGVPGDPIASRLSLDLNTGAGDGAGSCCIDNQTVGDTVSGMGVQPVGGVSELVPLNGTTTYSDTLLTVTGHATPLFTVPASVTSTTGIVAIKDSFEPSLEQPSGYTGRSVYFAFGFEGINNPGTFPNSTGTASRDQVMANVLSWLSDASTATIKAPLQNGALQASASLVSADLIAQPAPAIAATRWDFGDGSPVISTTASTQSHTYSASGSYILRVQVTDTLGHTALASTSLQVTLSATPPTASPASPTTTATAATMVSSGTPLPPPPALPAPQPPRVPPTATSSTTSANPPPPDQSASAPPATSPTTTPPPSGASTSVADTATTVTNARPAATPITGATAPPGSTAGPRSSVVPTLALTASNKPATVRGHHAKSCDLKKNLRKVEQGCEIVASISAPGATVVYTIAYPGPHGPRQSFTDMADHRGHSLHIFTVAYLPPVGAKHGAASTIALVTITASRPHGPHARPVTRRFVVVR